MAIERVDHVIMELVDAQSNDDGLWFEAGTATEAYLQQELRRLHKSIEHSDKFGVTAPEKAELSVLKRLVKTLGVDTYDLDTEHVLMKDGRVMYWPKGVDRYNHD